MDLLIAPNTVPYALRDMAPPTGTPGWATDGNPGASPAVPATIDQAYEYNAILEELTNVILWDGLTPLDRTNNAQLLASIQRMFRKRVVGGTLNLYVSSTGSDTNSGTTSASPLATINAALSLAATNYDLTGTVIQINLTDGTFAGFSLDGSLVPSQISLIGDTSHPSACIISGTNGDAIAVTRCGRLNLTGVFLTATGTEASYYNVGSAIVATAGASVVIGPDVIFGTCSSNHVECWTGSVVSVASPGPNQGTPYTIAGGAGTAHLYAAPGGYISVSDSTVTLTGTPSFGLAFCVAEEGLIGCYGCTFDGSAIGPRYNAALNGVIQTAGSGANYLPGNAAGGFSTGGEYV